MVFPETKRVVYNNNQLDNVICQLRFPPILSIDTEIPSKFQDAIRNEYPLYSEEAPTFQPVMPSELAPSFLPIAPFSALPPEIMNQIANSNKNHAFSSEDGLWRINLTRTFISFSASHYQRWGEFKEHFMKPFESLIEIYKPSFFTRTGLRYTNVFCRSKLNLLDTDWRDLIEDHILGMLSTDVSRNINSINSVCEIALDDKESVVQIMTSLVSSVDQSVEKDKCFMVDSDFYTQKRMLIHQVIEKLDYLNVEATNLISWIMKKKLYEAMGPMEYE